MLHTGKTGEHFICFRELKFQMKRHCKIQFRIAQIFAAHFVRLEGNNKNSKVTKE